MPGEDIEAYIEGYRKRKDDMYEIARLVIWYIIATSSIRDPKKKLPELEDILRLSHEEPRADIPKGMSAFEWTREQRKALEKLLPKELKPKDGSR